MRTAFGQIINIDFFLRHWLIVFASVVTVIFYISGNYLVKANRDELAKLRAELDIVRTERIRERENYMSRIRESQLADMLDTARLDLSVLEKPAYELDEP